MRPTVQTERVLNKLAVSDGQRRLASVPIPFQFRFVPPLSRSLDVARSRSEFSSIRVSIRGQFPDGRCSELGDRDGRKGFASGVAAIAGRKRARYRHTIARWKMSGRDPIRCPEDLCVCAATVTRRTEQEEREERGDNTERGVSGGVQIYAGATLMSAYVFSFSSSGPLSRDSSCRRNESPGQRANPAFDPERRRERERERFLSNFYTR